MNYRGFTTLELLTVIAIIGIMSSVLFVSLSPQKTSKELENAARQFTTDVKALQRSVLNGTSPSGVTEIVCGHGIYTNGTNEYKLFVKTKTSDAGGNCLDVSYSRNFSPGDEYRTQTFDSGVTITPTPTRSLYFQVPNAKVYGGGTTFTFGKGGEVCDVEISSTGEIARDECQ